MTIYPTIEHTGLDDKRYHAAHHTGSHTRFFSTIPRTSQIKQTLNTS